MCDDVLAMELYGTAPFVGRGGAFTADMSPPLANTGPVMAMPAPVGEYVEYDPTANAGAGEEGREEELAIGEPGTVLEVKHLDEVYDIFTGQWSVKPTPASAVAPPPKDSGKYDAYIFTVIRRFNPSTMAPDRKATSYTMTKVLEIHSEALRNVGKEIVGNVQGISWTAKPLRVSCSFSVHMMHRNVIFVLYQSALGKSSDFTGLAS